MEAATLAPEKQDENTPAEVATAVPSPVDGLYKWSSWVHIGPGAEACEAIDELKGSNDCENPLHFHAWCRLPNQFQHRAIREKALAGRARKTRLLRDPESDAYAVLEDEMDLLAREGDTGKAAIVNELVDKDWWRDYLEAVKDLADVEDEADADAGKDAKKWAGIHDDQRRYDELAALPDDERPEDEFKSLERHLTAYNEAVQARHGEIMAPKREALAARDLNDLIDELRTQRIAEAANEEFMHVYSVESWLVGALRHRNGPAVFAARKDLAAAAPEVIDALKETFDDLEQTKAHADSEGNS